MSIRKRGEDLAVSAYWDLTGMVREMERAFDDFRSGIERVPFGAGGHRLPAVDIRDEGTQYAIDVELPGLRKEDVTVEIADDTLVIKGLRAEAVETKSEEEVRRETDYQSFYRRIPLPPDADRSQAGAKMENGLLKVTLPKRAEPPESKRRLDVQ